MSYGSSRVVFTWKVVEHSSILWTNYNYGGEIGQDVGQLVWAPPAREARRVSQIFKGTERLALACLSIGDAAHHIILFEA